MISKVAPHTGAWIEIALFCGFVRFQVVAPHTGAWIEISPFRLRRLIAPKVAPHTGAWIEMSRLPLLLTAEYGRSPHGSVD